MSLSACRSICWHVWMWFQHSNLRWHAPSAYKSKSVHIFKHKLIHLTTFSRKKKKNFVFVIKIYNFIVLCQVPRKFGKVNLNLKKIAKLAGDFPHAQKIQSIHMQKRKWCFDHFMPCVQTWKCFHSLLTAFRAFRVGSVLFENDTID